MTHLVDAVQYLPAGTQVVLCAGAPDTPEIANEMRAKVEAVRRYTPGQPASRSRKLYGGGRALDCYRRSDRDRA